MHFAPAWDEMGSEESAHLILNEVFKSHGLPKQICMKEDPFLTPHFDVKSAVCLELSNACPLHTMPNLMGNLNDQMAQWKRC